MRVSNAWLRVVDWEKKTGEGFYVWKDGRPDRSDATEYKAKDLEALGRELVEPLIVEAQKALDEKVVPTADHVDAGVIFGTGFAPFRGGPLHYKTSREGGSSPGDKQSPSAAAAE